MSDAGNCFGSATAALTISNSASANVADYRVVITNLFGSTTSSVARLTLGTPVVASFTLSQTSGPAPLTVNFTNQSSGGMSSLLWSFGDGTYSTNTSLPPAAVAHQYALSCSAALPATNWVVLAVTNGALYNVFTNPAPVVVFPVPSPVLALGQTSVMTNVTMYFTNLSCSAAAGTVTWNFGDGSPLVTGAGPMSHSYATANTYPVILGVTNIYGYGALTLAQYVTATNNTVVTSVAGHPGIKSIKIAGGYAAIVVTNTPNSAGHLFYVMAQTNVAVARTNWMAVATNAFSADGGFTNNIPASATRQFYLIEAPLP
jgi:PKD repeat protein